MSPKALGKSKGRKKSKSGKAKRPRAPLTAEQQLIEDAIAGTRRLEGYNPALTPTERYRRRQRIMKVRRTSSEGYAGPRKETVITERGGKKIIIEPGQFVPLARLYGEARLEKKGETCAPIGDVYARRLAKLERTEGADHPFMTTDFNVATGDLVRKDKIAREISGGLGNTSKTGPAYGLPNWACRMGQTLAMTVPESTCAACYASRGKYGTCTVRRSHELRLAGLKHPRWVDAMVYLLTREMMGKTPLSHFRFHDSGDLQGPKHLEKLLKVTQTPPLKMMKFWIPTKEYNLIRDYLQQHGSFPENVTFRVALPRIDQAGWGKNRKALYPNIATVHSTDEIGEKFEDMGAYICPIAGKKKARSAGKDSEVPSGKDMPDAKACRKVRLKDGTIGCDACWRRNVPWVSYKQH